MIVIEGTIRVANTELAMPYMLDMIKNSRAESGCIDYAYAVDVTDPNLIRVSERWLSRPHLAAHVKSQHLVTWRDAWPKLNITERSLRLYEAEPEDF